MINASKSTKKYVSRLSDVPDGDHFAIMEFTSMTIPGDERSRTHPGHGYPESTEYFVRYIAFMDKEEWEREIKQRVEAKYGKTDFTAVFVKKASISTEIKVNVDVAGW